MTARTVRLVLDASAVVEFTRSSIHVGEVLSEIADEEGATAALPLACLVEAVHSAVDHDRLEILAAHPAVTVLAGDAHDWRALAELYDLMGRQDTAAAALLALDAATAVLTRQPALYAGVSTPDLVIPIDE